MLWDDRQLIAELDGFEYHHTRRAFEEDRDRDAQLLLAGYRVIRVTWEKVMRRPEQLAKELHGLLR